MASTSIATSSSAISSGEASDSALLPIHHQTSAQGASRYTGGARLPLHPCSTAVDDYSHQPPAVGRLHNNNNHSNHNQVHDHDHGNCLIDGVCTVTGACVNCGNRSQAAFEGSCCNRYDDHNIIHNNNHSGLPPTVTFYPNDKSAVTLSESVVHEIFNSETQDEANYRHDDDTSSTESRYVVPPDGGWGWVVVAASFFICFIVDSVAYSFPMIYTYLAEVHRQEGKEYNTNENAIMFFIGATLMALYMITAPFASALVNVYGTRRVIVLGSILTSTGLIISSRTQESDVYWLILTFGVMGGVGLGMMYIGAMVSVGTYFDKRRPLALALAVCGSGLGMGIFPLVAHHLFEKFGLAQTLQMYACFVLQGAWLGMLIWPLPPRPLHACAKPRRKDLLDRVTEWVDKLRHREDSCESLSDPSLNKIRTEMVRKAAQTRMIGLQRSESGLATPPTTPGSSGSIITNGTPTAFRSQTFNVQHLGEQLIDRNNNNDNQQQERQLELLVQQNLSGVLVDPLAISPVSPIGCIAQFQRCQSLKASVKASKASDFKSCPQISSLMWTPHASHSSIDPKSFKALTQQHCSNKSSPLASRLDSNNNNNNNLNNRPLKSSLKVRQQTEQQQENCNNNNNQQQQQQRHQTPYSSRSTSGVVCELADLADMRIPNGSVAQATANGNGGLNNDNSLDNSKDLSSDGAPLLYAAAPSDSLRSRALLSSAAAAAEKNILVDTQSFPATTSSPADALDVAINPHHNLYKKNQRHEKIDGSYDAASTDILSHNNGRHRAPHYGEMAPEDDDDDDDDDDKYLVSTSYRRTATGVTNGTVTNSSSDFAIIQASKPMPLLSPNCLTCVKKALEQSLDVSLLRDSRFWILAMGNITAMMGLYQIIFVLPALASGTDRQDDSPHITSVIMAVFGVTHTIGRVLTGIMSGPRFRPLLMCNTAFVLSMGVFAVFAFAQELLPYSVLCALAALHGLCYAFFAVLSTVIIVNVFGVRKLSSCFGMIMLARGLAPYISTLAYQMTIFVGKKSNEMMEPTYEDGNNSMDNLTSIDDVAIDDMQLEDYTVPPGTKLFIQRCYGIAGIIYVGLAFAFHLLLHFRYFKRRLLNVQRTPRPRLRCVSVPTPSSLSGYRLPSGGLEEDDVADESTGVAAITPNTTAVGNNSTVIYDGGEQALITDGINGGNGGPYPQDMQAACSNSTPTVLAPLLLVDPNNNNRTLLSSRSDHDQTNNNNNNNDQGEQPEPSNVYKQNILATQAESS